MEIEYSNEVRGRVHAFRFSSHEMEVISRRIKGELKIIDTRIERLRNHPKNEGQATWDYKIRQEFIKKEEIQSILDGFNGLY